MKNQDTLASARFIFTTGRMVHDLVTRIHTAACMGEGKSTRFGELSAQQMNMILMVRVRQAVSVSELAGLLGVSPPSVSAMVDRLVEKGVLCREHAIEDRRKVVVRVSPGAIKRVEAFEGSIMQLFVRLVEKIGLENAQKWCDVLANVKAVLDEEFDLPSLERSDRPQKAF